jgi:hypothetical protein
MAYTDLPQLPLQNVKTYKALNGFADGKCNRLSVGRYSVHISATTTITLIVALPNHF